MSDEGVVILEWVEDGRKYRLIELENCYRLDERRWHTCEEYDREQWVGRVIRKLVQKKHDEDFSKLLRDSGLT